MPRSLGPEGCASRKSRSLESVKGEVWKSRRGRSARKLLAKVVGYTSGDAVFGIRIIIGRATGKRETDGIQMLLGSWIPATASSTEWKSQKGRQATKEWKNQRDLDRAALEAGVIGGCTIQRLRVLFSAGAGTLVPLRGATPSSGMREQVAVQRLGHGGRVFPMQCQPITMSVDYSDLWRGWVEPLAVKRR